MKHKINIITPQHGAISVRHSGNDTAFCEAGETVIINWQPEAGWGLSEAKYAISGQSPVTIEGGAFNMPDSDITVSAVFKRFSVDDWEGYSGVVGENGNVIQSDGNGGIVANAKVNVFANGDVSADGNVSANGDVFANGDVNAKGNVNANGDVSADGNVSANGDVNAKGDVSANGGYETIDTVNGNRYRITVANGQIVVSPVS